MNLVAVCFTFVCDLPSPELKSSKIWNLCVGCLVLTYGLCKSLRWVTIGDLPAHFQSLNLVWVDIPETGSNGFITFSFSLICKKYSPSLDVDLRENWDLGCTGFNIIVLYFSKHVRNSKPKAIMPSF